MGVPLWTCGSPWTIRGSWLCLSTIWVPGIEVTSSGLEVGTFTHRAISSACAFPSSPVGFSIMVGYFFPPVLHPFPFYLFTAPLEIRASELSFVRFIIMLLVLPFVIRDCLLLLSLTASIHSFMCTSWVTTWERFSIPNYLK